MPFRPIAVPTEAHRAARLGKQRWYNRTKMMHTPNEFRGSHLMPNF